jgi:hypothetical protein
VYHKLNCERCTGNSNPAPPERARSFIYLHGSSDTRSTVPRYLRLLALSKILSFFHSLNPAYPSLSGQKRSKMWSNTSSSNPASPTTPQIPSVSPSTTTSRPTYRLKNQGRRVAQIVKLKPECVAKYKECHARVWPEVLKQIKDCNIEDCGSLCALFLKDFLLCSSLVCYEDKLGS